jgi:hypothetical protein
VLLSSAYTSSLRMSVSISLPLHPCTSCISIRGGTPNFVKNNLITYHQCLPSSIRSVCLSYFRTSNWNPALVTWVFSFSLFRLTRWPREHPRSHLRLGEIFHNPFIELSLPATYHHPFKTFPIAKVRQLFESNPSRSSGMLVD